MEISKKITFSVGATECECGTYDGMIVDFTETTELGEDGVEKVTSIPTVPACRSCGEKTNLVGVQTVQFDV